MTNMRYAYKSKTNSTTNTPTTTRCNENSYSKEKKLFWNRVPNFLLLALNYFGFTSFQRIFEKIGLPRKNVIWAGKVWEFIFTLVLYLASLLKYGIWEKRIQGRYKDEEQQVIWNLQRHKHSLWVEPKMYLIIESSADLLKGILQSQKWLGSAVSASHKERKKTLPPTSSSTYQLYWKW